MQLTTPEIKQMIFKVQNKRISEIFLTQDQ